MTVFPTDLPPVDLERPTILVIGNPHKMDSDFRKKSMRFLGIHCDVIKEDIDNRTPGQKERPDFAVVFGGDGTMLRAAQEINRLPFPLPAIGVNLGTVGFLTEISPDEFEKQMSRVILGEGSTSDRMMLQCVVGNDDDPLVALNDIVIQGKGQITLDFEICIDGIEVADFRGDGLIVATPSGSTGYNLSAGGPLISPGVDAMTITAICPHSLTTRPVVVGANEVIKVRLPKDTFRGREPVVIVDGQVSDELMQGEALEISRHHKSFKLLQLNMRGHYQTMRDKLHWGRSIKHG